MTLNLVKHKANGFTLLEMLITLSIISVLSLLAFNSFVSSIEAQNANSAAQQLTYALKKAKYYAKSNGTTVYVKFNISSNQYEIKTPNANGKSLTQENMFDGFSGKLPEGTKVIDSTCNYFYFYVDGSPVIDTYNTPLANDCFILVGVSNSYTKIVQVNSKTGKISYE